MNTKQLTFMWVSLFIKNKRSSIINSQNGIYLV